jgi:predicted HD superfamily hydrolase involved in NAD metabolism
MANPIFETAYLPFLTKKLSPRRLEHSLGTMQTMGELAAVYRQDVEKARIIGLLHDAAKELPDEEQLRLFTEAGWQIPDEAGRDYVLMNLHGPASAWLVRQELGITDELILGAIATHCFFGDETWFDHPLSWCVRFADIIEPSRRWTAEEVRSKAVNELREAAYAGKMWEAALIMAESKIKTYPLTGHPIHPKIYEIQKVMAGRQ